ncbi:MAG: hypothetical protein AAGF89_03580 [Bacteroidota bacterium]
MLPLLVFACRPKPTTASRVVVLDPNEPFEYLRYRPDSLQRPENYVFPRTRVFNSDYYEPDTTNLDLLPQRTLMVNIHIMNTTDTLYQYYGEQGKKYAQDVVMHCNVVLNRRPKSYLMPDSVDVPALPPRIRVQLAKKPGTNEDAIYEHYDDKLYWYLHKGRNVNRSDKAVVRKYAVNKDSVLNVFAMGPLRDSLISKTYKIYGVNGIFLGDAIKLTGWLSRDRGPWEVSNVLLHEIAHGLGLRHAWLRNDGCDDTPVHKNNFWKLPSGQRGPGKTSNNLMDYSNRQEALTPCQIGRMHARLSDISGRQRKWLRRDWCTYLPDKPLRIATETDLEGARDFSSDIFIERGGTLRINTRIHLPEGAAIYVDPGGRLELGPKAVIHNDCGGQWGGILVGETESGIRGEVTYVKEATLIDVVP